jgi:hypothetical protein
MQPAPALDQLMGAYFHQDWEYEADDTMGIVDLFVQGEPVLAPLLPREIDDILATYQSEAELKTLVIDDLGGYYLADWDGGTYRAWLQQIADRVRAATATPDR